MKKILFAAPLLAILLVACDPITEDVSMDAGVTAEELTNSFQLTPKSEGNNNITVNLAPVRYVKVYSANDDAVVCEGTGNLSFQVVPPAREVSYYITTMNHDGSITKSSPKSLNVSTFTDLPAIFDKVFGVDGGYGTTTWVWDTEASDGLWGNGGYQGNNGPGWWIVTADQIDEQAVGASLPNDGLDGWFSLSLTGVNTSRGETGSVNVTEDVVLSGWDIGTMKFSGTMPLMGVQPNSGNQRQYDYHILQADGEHLRLCAPEPGAAAWGTAWFWNFKRK